MNYTAIDALTLDNKIRVKQLLETLLQELQLLPERHNHTYTIPVVLLEKQSLDKQVVFNLVNFLNENGLAIVNITKRISEEVEKVIARPMYLPSMTQIEISKKKEDATYSTIKRFTYKLFLSVDDYYNSYILEIHSRAALSTLYEYLISLSDVNFLHNDQRVVSSFGDLKLTEDGNLYENDLFAGKITLPEGSTRFKFMKHLMISQSERNGEDLFVTLSELQSKVGSGNYISMYTKINNELLQNTSYRIKTSKGKGFMLSKNP